MRIAFTFNVKRGDPSLEPGRQKDIEFDSPEVIDLIKKNLEKLGHKVEMIEADLDAFEKLRRLKDKVDIVFNIAEGVGADARESQIPIFCEMLKIPYTHSSPTVHAIALNKYLTGEILKSAGVRVPNSTLIERSSQIKEIKMKFPLIIKPNKEGSSKGIYDKNVVDNKKDLGRRIRFMLKNFGPVIVEEFIDGREFTVALLGSKPRVLPIVEQRFDFLPDGFKKIAGYELKWFFEDSLNDLSKAYKCLADLTEKQKKEIENTSLKIFKSLGVFDAARIDYRMDKSGKVYFLEINTLPGLNFKPNAISYFPLAARTVGLTPEMVLGEILDSAVKRFGL